MPSPHKSSPNTSTSTSPNPATSTSTPPFSTSVASAPTPAISTPAMSGTTISTPKGRTPEKIESPNASFNELFGLDILKFSVGKGIDEQEFRIHKNNLCQKAPVFARMFSGTFVEQQSDEATLPEDNPRAFDMIASWLYTNTVKAISSVRSELQKDYILPFIFAEKYGIVQLADNTMDSYIEMLLTETKRPGAALWAQAYEGTHAASKLRLFMSRCWAYAVLHNKDGGRWANSSLVPTGVKAEEILINGMGKL